MKYCSRCLYPESHPLNLVFDEEGVCSGCRVHEEKDTLDWAPRREKLRGLLDAYRCKSGRNYDCIIPVSGARNSYFIVHTVKNVFGLNPLLVTYNKQYNTDVGIRNLANLRIQFGCDILTLTVNPATVKKITRATLRCMGSIYWHCLAGQTVFPVQVAVRFKIPLIIWGAHQGVDQVGMFSHLDEVEMTRKYRKEHDLMGFEAEDLIDDFDAIREEDIVQYLYPDDKMLERVGVRGIYLNNYIRWDTKAQHEEMIRLYGYETYPQSRTFDSYNDVDCFNYSDVHDYLKWLKHGYAKVTDHASREIRLRRLTREQALQLVRNYTVREPRHLKLFLDWLGITESGFHYLADQFRSPAAWRRDGAWRWERIGAAWDLPPPDNADAVRLALRETGCEFRQTQPRRPGYVEDRYILVGKGYPEA